MKKMNALVTVLVLLAAARSRGIDFELGAISGGGLCFPIGSYFDAKAAQLAELGASALDKPGSSRVELFPGWTAGAYVEAGFFEWFGVRVEPRIQFFGSSSLALTDAGAAFDRYGVYFHGIVLPVSARGRLLLGPGFATIAAGPFAALVVSDITIVDRYASSTTTVHVALDLPNAVFLGIAGAVGYSLELGPGTAALELRADFSLTPAASRLGPVGGDIFPFSVSLVASYGMSIGGVWR